MFPFERFFFFWDKEKGFIRQPELAKLIHSVEKSNRNTGVAAAKREKKCA